MAQEEMSKWTGDDARTKDPYNAPRQMRIF